MAVTDPPRGCVTQFENPWSATNSVELKNASADTFIVPQMFPILHKVSLFSTTPTVVIQDSGVW